MLKRLKIKNRLFILILGINLIMLIAVYGIYIGFSKRMLVSETQAKAMEKVNAVALALEGYFNGKGKIAWTYCQNPYLKRWLETGCERGVDHSADSVYRDIISHFQELVKNDKEIRAAFLASEKSQEYFEDAERTLPPDYFVGKREWYQQMARIGQPHFNCDVDILDKKIYLNYIFPIYNQAGELLGCGGVDLSLDNLDSFLSDLDIFKTGQVFLINADGTYIFHPDTAFILDKKISDFEDDDKKFKNVKFVSEKMTSFQSGIEPVVFGGEKRYFIYTPVRALGWTLVLSVSANEINAPMRKLTNTSLIIAAMTSVFLILIIFMVTGSISKPIRRLVSIVKDIAQGEGDLTRRLDMDGDDEICELAHWLNVFMDRLHDIIVQVRLNAVEVAKVTDVVNSESSSISTSTEEQNSQTSAVAMSVQEIATAIGNDLKNAHETSEIVERATADAQKGSEAMKTTRQGIEDVVSSATKTGEIVGSLSARTDQIDEIVGMIDEIADQTNLLALNAAIEAARAGEQGRGFAVVADEVQKLAERTTKATKEIADTIRAIQDDTKEVSQSMTKSNAQLDDARQAVVETERILSEIVGSIAHVMERIRQIVASAEQQRTGAEEISTNVEAINTVTEKTAQASEQMSMNAEQLKTQTETLKQILNKFRLPEIVSEAESHHDAEKAVHNGGVSDLAVSREGVLRT
jgi:methyl-accepting chemotaxis protein